MCAVVMSWPAGDIRRPPSISPENIHGRMGGGEEAEESISSQTPKGKKKKEKLEEKLGPD